MQRDERKFFWGAATSAHQVEGGNANDWSLWEKKHAAALAKKASTREWPDHILHAYPSPLDEANYISDRACDHYHRYEEDFDTAKSLGHNAHRLSIEWSRIEPEEGKFDEKEIEHYRQVIKALRARGMEPFVTLWHWTLPLWLRDKGGVASREFPQSFARYAERIAREYRDDVRFWITINEPMVYSSHTYLTGAWPPNRRNPFVYLRVVQYLIKAHQMAHTAIKKINSDAQVGIAKNNIHFEAASGRVNVFLKRITDWWWNIRFLGMIRDTQDFIGLNHYFHNKIDYGFNKNKNAVVSDMGWEVYPQSLYHVLVDLKRYEKPIYITENGIADARDINRSQFIKESVVHMHRAMQEGVDVRGYFYWSLLDNFEWDKGFWPRFGLVEVDYHTLERRVRKSAWDFKEIITDSSAK